MYFIIGPFWKSPYGDIGFPNKIHCIIFINWRKRDKCSCSGTVPEYYPWRLEVVPMPGHTAQIFARASTKSYVQTGARARELGTCTSLNGAKITASEKTKSTTPETTSHHMEACCKDVQVVTYHAQKLFYNFIFMCLDLTNQVLFLAFQTIFLFSYFCCCRGKSKLLSPTRFFQQFVNKRGVLGQLLFKCDTVSVSSEKSFFFPSMNQFKLRE